MLFDNPTLFNVLLVQALAAALLLLSLEWLAAAARPPAGPRPAWVANALGWLLIEASASLPELARGLQTMAMVAFSASLSALWWALQLWLLRRRRPLVDGRRRPVLLGLGYGIHFHDSVSFRLAWSQAWLGLQCLMLTLSLALPRPQQELHPDMSATAAELQPSSVSLRWRALLLSAIVPIGLICLLRASLTAVGLQDASSLANLHLAGAANSLLGLTVHWSLTAGLLGLVLAWRGEAEAELARLAQTDSLTGLADARAFAARSVALISMARRHQEPLALVLLDLDHLKAINASHGNEGGDRALALFGSCIQAQMRLGDLAGRIGPEEFGVLMARCDAQGPEALDARLRTALAQRAPAELGFELAYSGGWAKLRHGDRDIEDLKRRAETALYEAKRGGRARICRPSPVCKTDFARPGTPLACKQDKPWGSPGLLIPFARTRRPGHVFHHPLCQTRRQRFHRTQRPDGARGRPQMPDRLGAAGRQRPAGAVRAQDRPQRSAVAAGTVRPADRRRASGCQPWLSRTPVTLCRPDLLARRVRPPGPTTQPLDCLRQRQRRRQ